MGARTLSGYGAGVMDMDTLISPDYVAQNRSLLEGGSGFGFGGHRHTRLVKLMAGTVGARSILDYGCGHGVLGYHLRRAGWRGPVHEYGAGIPERSEVPPPAEVVGCGSEERRVG